MENKRGGFVHGLLPKGENMLECGAGVNDKPGGRESSCRAVALL